MNRGRDLEREIERFGEGEKDRWREGEGEAAEALIMQRRVL